MKKLTLIVIFLVLISPACSLAGELIPGEKTLPDVDPSAQLVGEKRCGDGICDGPENADSCPQDCSADSAPALGDNLPGPEAQSDIHWVVNPSSGVRLYVEIFKPEGWSGEALPVLVLIPGGSGDSSDFIEKPQKIHTMLESGFTLVVFDPDGRGNSKGEEDDNGNIHQDGLAAVIEYAAALPELDSDQIGLVSYSYGITMAAGALARHPKLPIRFLIDWEGPANRNDTGGCDEDNLGHLIGHPCDDEDFWSQREASGFALKLQLPYLRLQSEQDHVQPDNGHALLMISNATAEKYGGHGRSPWTRLNDLVPNTIYAEDNLPPMLLEGVARSTEQLIIAAAKELFTLQIQ